MKKILYLFFIPTFFFSNFLLSQDFAEGTMSRRNNGASTTFHPMAGFNSEEFEQYHWTGNNPNAMAGRNPMNFRVLKPKNYDPNREEPYPIIMMLHGIGEGATRGYNNTDARYL